MREMKKSTAITVEILKDIRGEIKKTNARLDQTNARLDTFAQAVRGELTDVRGELQELRDDLGRRIVESEMRTATAITDLHGTVRELTSVLRNQADLRPRVEKCEQEIVDIKEQLARVS